MELPWPIHAYTVVFDSKFRLVVIGCIRQKTPVREHDIQTFYDNKLQKCYDWLLSPIRRRITSSLTLVVSHDRINNKTIWRDQIFYVVRFQVMYFVFMFIPPSTCPSVRPSISLIIIFLLCCQSHLSVLYFLCK